MAKLIFECTAVSPKDNDAGVHIVMHGSTDSKDSFRGPPPNSIVSLWPRGTALEGIKVGKKYELVEVVEVAEAKAE